MGVRHAKVWVTTQQEWTGFLVFSHNGEKSSPGRILNINCIKHVECCFCIEHATGANDGFPVKQKVRATFKKSTFINVTFSCTSMQPVDTSERSNRRWATYRFVQGKPQAAMFVQHKESPLPFLSKKGRQCRLKFTQCAFHQKKNKKHL